MNEDTPKIFKIFIGWSKKESFAVAEILAEWLEDFFQGMNIDIFLSENSIPPGKNSINVIKEALRSANAGIFCITKDHFSGKSSWLHGEAGAITGNSNNKHNENLVIPFLYGVNSDEVLKSEKFRSLLKSNQQVEWNKEKEVKKMMEALNNSIGELDLSNYNEKLFNKKFKSNYPNLYSSLENIKNMPVGIENNIDNVDLTVWEEEVLWVIFKKGNSNNSYLTSLNKIYKLVENGSFCHGEIYQALLLLEVRKLIKKKTCGTPSIALTNKGQKTMTKLDKYATSHGFDNNDCK